MKHFTFDHHWDEIKGQLKQRYGQLTDDDLTFAEGKGEELLGRLREKLGVSTEELKCVLDELRHAAGNPASKAREKAAELAGEVRAKTTAAVDEAKVQAGAAYDQARQRVRTLQEDGEEYVRQNPRQALLAALLAGFVAGLVIRR